MVSGLNPQKKGIQNPHQLELHQLVEGEGVKLCMADLGSAYLSLRRLFPVAAEVAPDLHYLQVGVSTSKASMSPLGKTKGFSIIDQRLKSGSKDDGACTHLNLSGTTQGQQDNEAPSHESHPVGNKLLKLLTAMLLAV
eukprot:2533279-Amphidinium_carterae.1